MTTTKLLRAVAVQQRTMMLYIATILSLAVFAPQLRAQKLHTNHRWEQCAIVLDSSLTQAAWHQFAGELALVAYFRPMTSAAPMGKGRFELGLVNAGTRINDADAAWNDTFSHPDSTHWLFEGNALYVPGVMARAGITDRIDAGVYFTDNPSSNYGLIGGQVQYGMLYDPDRRLAAAGRVTVVRLFGPEDMQASTYAVDFLVSKGISIVEPYVGVSSFLSHARATTSKVSLDDENVLGAQAMVGVSARLAALRVAGELSVAKVRSVSMKVALDL